MKKKLKEKNKNSSLSFSLQFYEGYQGQERPSAIILGERKIKIEKIIWRQRVKDFIKGEQREIFFCQTEDSYLKLTVFPGGQFIVDFID